MEEKFKLIFLCTVSFVVLIVFPIFAIWANEYNDSPKTEFKNFEESFNKGYMSFDTFDKSDNLYIRYDDTKFVIILDDTVSSENRKELQALLSSKDVKYDYVSKETLLEDLLVKLDNDEIMKDYYKNNNPFNDYIIMHFGYKTSLGLERKEGIHVYELQCNNIKLEVKDAGKIAVDFEFLYWKNYAENYRNIKLDLNSITKKVIKNNLYEISVDVFIEPLNDTKIYTFIMSSNTILQGKSHSIDWHIFGIKDLLNTTEFFDKYFL